MKRTKKQSAAIKLALQIAGDRDFYAAAVPSDWWDRRNALMGVEHLSLMLDCYHPDITTLKQACANIYFELTRKYLLESKQNAL